MIFQHSEEPVVLLDNLYVLCCVQEQLIEQRLPPADVVFATSVNIPQFVVDSSWVGVMMTPTADGTQMPTYETLSVIISYVVSPALFFIQFEDDAIDHLFDIEQEMNMYALITISSTL